MRAIIIEDELPARARLVAMLKAVAPQMEVAAQLGSVKETLRWLENNPGPDLAFVDIQLSDDHSFEIFRQHPAKFPVIFTTAYDKYILESFEFNSVDYLLKPITEGKLIRSLEKVKKLQDHFLQGNLLKILNHIQSTSSHDRILAKKGTGFIALGLNDIAYFFTEHKIVFAKDFTGRQLIVDKTITELEGTVDPSKFFRINRKYLCCLNAIERFKPDKGRIKIHLVPDCKEDVYVSKETAPLFRQWIG